MSLRIANLSTGNVINSGNYLKAPHMSAEPKWCFLNYPILAMSFIRGYVSSNQIHLLFGIFVQKMVKNTWKRAFKGLYWFGLAWLCLSNNPGEVLTFQNLKNCIKIAKTLTIKYHWNCLILAFSIAPFWTFWSIFLFKHVRVNLGSQPNHDQTKPSLLWCFLSSFWPFFGQKYQKVNGFDLRTHIP